MKEVFAVLEANYPENLHSSYVINGSSRSVVVDIERIECAHQNMWYM